MFKNHLLTGSAIFGKRNDMKLFCQTKRKYSYSKTWNSYYILRDLLSIYLFWGEETLILNSIT